jgi:hypothetical protein
MIDCHLAVAFSSETQEQIVVSWTRRIPLAVEKMAYYLTL